MPQKKVYALKDNRGKDVAYITSDNNFIILNFTKMWGRPLILDSEVTSGFNLDDFAGSINPKNSARMSAILNVVPYTGTDSPMRYSPSPRVLPTVPACTDKVVMVEQYPDENAAIKLITPLYEKIVTQFDYIEDVTGKVTIVY